MEQLKSLLRRNKELKRQIKKMEEEIDKRTENNPALDDFDGSPERMELDQENLLDKLMDSLMLSKDQHLRVCSQASSSFSRAIAQAKQSLGSRGPVQVKRPRLSHNVSFGGSFNLSNSRPSALSELSLDSISNRTFVRRSKYSTGSESAGSILNRTVTLYQADRKPSLNKTFAKASLRKEDSKGSIINNDLTPLNRPAIHCSAEDKQVAGSPLKKIARPSIRRPADKTKAASGASGAEASIGCALNRTFKLTKIRVPSEENETPADPTDSTTLPKSRSDSTLSKTRKKTKNETILNETAAKTRSRSQSKLLNRTVTKTTALAPQQEVGSNGGALPNESVTCDSPFDATAANKTSALLGATLFQPNLTAFDPTPHKYNLRKSVRSAQKKYTC